MANHRKITAEMEPEVRRLYKEGHAVTVMAKTLGVSLQPLRAALRRMDLAVTRTRRRSGLTSDQLKAIKKSYLEGMGTKALGDFYGVNDATIARALRTMGIALRPAGFQRGRDHHAWIGGRVQTSQGYVLSRVYEDDPLFCMAKKKAAGASYALEHRLVMARHLGRPLKDFETVHHRDGDRQNNRIRNLQLLTGRHGKGACFRCGDCGSYNVKPARLGAH